MTYTSFAIDRADTGYQMVDARYLKEKAKFDARYWFLDKYIKHLGTRNQDQVTSSMSYELIML